jgi:outer membrane protein OmpA-like peptidoglycan-associated protein
VRLELERFIGPSGSAKAGSAKPDNGNTGRQSARTLAADLGRDAERIGTLASAIAIAAKLQPPPVERAALPSGRDRLDAVFRAKAIFFAEGTSFRDATTASTVLDEIGRAITDAGLLVRVVGFTDDTGTAAGNQTLSRQRAVLVRDALIRRGVAPRLLIAIGRSDATAIATADVRVMANRRVSFEVAYDGEAAP